LTGEEVHGGRVSDSWHFAGERQRLILFLAVCALGVSSIVTQLTLMRELLATFAGNEMVLGVILGNWLLLTGVGSYLGKTASRLNRPLTVLVIAQVLVAVLPIADVVAVRTLRNAIFIRGAEVGITETVVSCFVLLLPYCLIAGYLLTLACSLLTRQSGPASIGQVYFLDNLGDIGGGLLFSFVLIYLFNHFGILYVPAFLNLFFAGLVAWTAGKRILISVAGLVAIALTAMVAAYDMDALTTRVEYAGQEVVHHSQSPYGRLVVTESAGQFNFIENGVPLFSTHNIEQVEETVHYAMVQRPQASAVLVISGGVSGTAREILKYGVQRVDYVELDPLVIDVGRRFVPENLADERIHVMNLDGRLFVKRTDRRYDVVIVDVPDPSTFQLNRFYTQQFFNEVGAILSRHGVVGLSLGHYENFVSDELAAMLAVAHKTLKQRFENVMMIPGGRVFFVASNGPIHRDIAGRLERLGIDTQFVTRPYLAATLTPDRLADLRRSVSDHAAVNRDFNPVLYYYHLLYWASQFKVRFGLLQAGLVLIFLVYVVRLRAAPFAIFTTGFAASGLVVILLVGFQILYGYVYHKVGLIVTMFMVGLAVGSFVMNRRLEKCTSKALVKLEMILVVYAVLLPMVLAALGRVVGGWGGSIVPQAAFSLLAAGLAVVVGMEFPLAGKVDFRTVTSTAAGLYTADFMGACVGALLVSTLLIPVLGVTAVCWLTGGLNLVSAARLAIATRG